MTVTTSAFETAAQVRRILKDAARPGRKIHCERRALVGTVRRLPEPPAAPIRSTAPPVWLNTPGADGEQRPAIANADQISGTVPVGPPKKQ
jgi:hypothetical protein